MNVDDFVDAALAHVGRDYIWRGKGFQMWDPVRGLVSSPWVDGGFDCSGLVTVAMRTAKGPDKVATWNAKAMFEALEPVDRPPRGQYGHLHFYGPSSTQIDHVAIALGNGLVLEAAGGGSTTTTPKDARRIGARVRLARDRRLDFRGARLLPTSPNPRA